MKFSYERDVISLHMREQRTAKAEMIEITSTLAVFCDRKEKTV